MSATPDEYGGDGVARTGLVFATPIPASVAPHRSDIVVPPGFMLDIWTGHGVPRVPPERDTAASWSAALAVR